jgi:hypothetical protein
MLSTTKSSKRSKKSTAEAVFQTPEVPHELEQEKEGTVAEVAEAAEESNDGMKGIEEDSRPEETGEVENDGQGGVDGAATHVPRLTMEERKTKLIQLRKKIVCLLFIFYTYDVDLIINTTRPPLQRPTAYPSLKRARKPKSAYGMQRDWRGSASLQKCYGRKRMLRNGGRTSRGKRTGSGRLKRTRIGRRNWRGRHGERTLSFMVG